MSVAAPPRQPGLQEPEMQRESDAIRIMNENSCLKFSIFSQRGFHYRHSAADLHAHATDRF